jgi:hypothetical protein
MPKAGSKPEKEGEKSISDEARTDKASKDSFPASDPPAHTGTTGPTGTEKPKQQTG